MPTAADTEQGRRQAALAAGGALAVAAAGDEEQQPSPTRRAAVAAAILASLVSWLAHRRSRMVVWMREQMAGRASSDDIERVIAEEQRREEAFAQKQAARMALDLQTALALPTRATRENAVRAIMRREEIYARQRSEAQAARAFAAIDRVVVRQQSPNGAFWKLDPTVAEHTAGCLLMGGKFWPWQVLDRVHPPRHPGCPCRLVSYGQAVAEGLLAPGAVMDARHAVRLAAGVVMEAQMYRAGTEGAGMLRDLLFEANLIEREDVVIEAGIVSLEDVERARDGLVLGLGEFAESGQLAEVGVGRDQNGVFAYGVQHRTASHARREDIPLGEIAAVL